LNENRKKSRFSGAWIFLNIYFLPSIYRNFAEILLSTGTIPALKGINGVQVLLLISGELLMLNSESMNSFMAKAKNYGLFW